MKRLFAITLALSFLLLAGCRHNSGVNSTPAPVPIDVRIAQYTQIVATANSNLVPVVVNLKEAGVISPETAQKFAVYQAAVATATKGMAGILASPEPWGDKAIQIQNLALSLVPPAGYQKLGLKDETEYKALVLAIDSIESTFRIIVQMAQEARSK